MSQQQEREVQESPESQRLGFHHLGLATHDMEATLEFYERVMGFDAKVCEMIEPEAGGAIRHAFLDVGNGEMLAFMEILDVPGVSNDFDTSINRGLLSGPGVYHFAFRAKDSGDLAQRQRDLEAKGVRVRGPVDHGWCLSIYFRDPNGLQLEYCCLTADLGDAHRAAREGKTWRRFARS